MMDDQNLSKVFLKKTVFQSACPKSNIDTKNDGF